MITQLNLPKPSDELLRHAIIISNESTEVTERQLIAKNYLAKFVKNSTPGWFFSVEELATKFVTEYGSFFDDWYLPQIGVFPNKSNSTYATLPAHVDKIRSSCINYIIATGGDNVITEFYHTPEHIKTTEQIQMGNYKNLTVHTKAHTIVGNWYLLDVQKYHSVQYIENKRVTLSIGFKLSYDEFLLKYKHLVMD
jgi:hypothetical protein